MSSTSLEATLRTFPVRNAWNVLCHESWCTHSIQTKRLTEGLKYILVVVWSVCWAEIIIKILGNLLAVSNPKPYLMNPEKTANTEPKCHMSYTWEVFCMWLSLFMWEGDLCLCFPKQREVYWATPSRVSDSWVLGLEEKVKDEQDRFGWMSIFLHFMSSVCSTHS